MTDDPRTWPERGVPVMFVLDEDETIGMRKAEPYAPPTWDAQEWQVLDGAQRSRPTQVPVRLYERRPDAWRTMPAPWKGSPTVHRLWRQKLVIR
jgi:hypothetical protein